MAMFYLTIVFVFLGKFFSSEFIWSIHVYLQYCEILQLFSYFNVIYVCDQSCIFSIITAVFRNHNNILIYYQY